MDGDSIGEAIAGLAIIALVGFAACVFLTWYVGGCG